MIRYTRIGDQIKRMVLMPWGSAALITPARVPAPVRETFKNIPACGHVEVEWDPKARKAKFVPS